MRFPLALSLAFLAVGAQAAETQFLFDVLHGRGAYRASWDRLLKLVQPTPDWLVQFNKNLDGAAGQVTMQTIDGAAYEISFVCKPQECAAHKFEVLFETASKKAYGALGGVDNSPGFFGAPPPPLQDALAKAIRGKS